ncbi:Phosphatidylinositol 4-kinase alpha 1-like [Melia azedarach]|uniref:Phosphatidylinositol 4-kinase alpha 1-like n=1 Tax=Melia azedarach TaxID=155640 RepID=A0ACC1XW94_MELAZ|nr:Phosphatidylinositol 4-kinase alpha 1-like [Melia azedarach]
MNSGGSIIGGFNLNDRQQFRQQVASYEEESVEGLKKQEIAYKLITHVLDKVQIDSKHLEQVRFIAKQQLQSMAAFLKIRKRDWNEQGPLLKARINEKLSVCQSVTRLKIKSLASLDMDGKTSKRLVPETLALLVDAAEACLLSLLDAASRMATLGFEKSYRETVVLMTRSYLSKLVSVGSTESKTMAAEATAEHVEDFF